MSKIKIHLRKMKDSSRQFHLDEWDCVWSKESRSPGHLFGRFLVHSLYKMACLVAFLFSKVPCYCRAKEGKYLRVRNLGAVLRKECGDWEGASSAQLPAFAFLGSHTQWPILVKGSVQTLFTNLVWLELWQRHGFPKWLFFLWNVND